MTVALFLFSLGGPVAAQDKTSTAGETTAYNGCNPSEPAETSEETNPEQPAHASSAPDNATQSSSGGANNTTVPPAPSNCTHGENATRDDVTHGSGTAVNSSSADPGPGNGTEDSEPERNDVNATQDEGVTQANETAEGASGSAGSATVEPESGSTWGAECTQTGGESSETVAQDASLPGEQDPSVDSVADALSIVSRFLSMLHSYQDQAREVGGPTFAMGLEDQDFLCVVP